MLKNAILLCVVFSVGFGEIEVIKISDDLSEHTKNYIWPAFANGGVNVDSGKVYLPNGNEIYFQSRFNPAQVSKQKIDIDGHNYFSIYKLCLDQDDMCMIVLYTDGMFYLYKENRQNQKINKLVLRHGVNDRIVFDEKGNVLSTGVYRPNYAKMLRDYDDESVPGKTAEELEKWKEFYEDEKGFTLSVFDENLKLIDSSNIIQRIGEDARGFDDLYVKHPLDLSKNGDVYIIDNLDGYRIKKFNASLSHIGEWNITNKKFKAIPHNLTREKARQLKARSGSYSVAYALYVKNQYIISSFYQSTSGRDLPQPPYFYDVSTLDGNPVASGELAYPIISEDDGDKIFLLVKQEGGWFEDDLMFLVGITIEDLLNGKAGSAHIGKAVERYMGENK